MWMIAMERKGNGGGGGGGRIRTCQHHSRELWKKKKIRCLELAVRVEAWGLVSTVCLLFRKKKKIKKKKRKESPLSPVVCFNHFV